MKYSQRIRNRSFLLPCFLWILCTVALIAGPAAHAQGTDRVGVYFDPAYTSNEIHPDNIPGIVPAHIVLKNPTAAGGVGGWECWLRIDGPALLAGTDYAGNALNVETPPVFLVGIADPPLPGGNEVLLATVNLFVTEPEPVVLSLQPLYRSSLPGEMAYLDAANTTDILPMYSATGEEIVAGINVGWDPICDLAPSVIGFTEAPVGDAAVRSFTISNLGLAPLELDLQFLSAPGPFSLNGRPEGPLTIGPRDEETITIRFSPTQLGYFEVLLRLGGTCDDVLIYGSAREPHIAWQAPAELDFGEAIVGQTTTMSFQVRNVGEVSFAIVPYLPPDCGSFSVVSDYVSTVYPDNSRTITVRFTPTSVGAFTCELDLGETVPAVTLTGTARLPDTTWEAPESVDFGDVDFGDTRTLPVTVTNTGEESLSLYIVLQSDCQAFTYPGVANVTLPPGASHTTQITFQPFEMGRATCELSMGAVVPPVTLLGSSSVEVIDFAVLPTAVLFSPTLVSETDLRPITFFNRGNVPIAIAPELAPPVAGLNIASGSAPIDVPPGSQRVIGLEFAPPAPGAYSSTLVFGEGLPEVPVSGTGLDASVECVLTPLSIDFGSVWVGSSVQRIFNVTNVGNVALVVNPNSYSSAFTVSPTGYISILPDQTQTFQVTFRPIADGVYDSAIDLGSEACGYLPVSGNGVLPPSQDQDLVGFTFEAASLQYGYFENATYTSAGSTVEAYLALVNPSTMDPLAGFECCAAIEGPGIYTGWQIEGQPINILSEPCFLVGLGSPFPPAPYYILATTQILVTNSDEDVVLSLGPIYHASIAGEMAWLTGPDGQEIRIMRSVTGMPESAVINTGGLVGISAPLPSAQVTASAVALSWTVPAGTYDGCRIYRRAAGAIAEVLADRILPISGQEFRFSDEASGFEPGTVLYYSYALLENGQETARSSEVEVQLKNFAPAASRLLPNVPNPFNPQTEIRFELAKAGRARVTIFDVTGRKVRTLIDQSMSAGPQARMWFGKDDRGQQAPSGTYYVRLETDGKIDTRKLLLLK